MAYLADMLQRKTKAAPADAWEWLVDTLAEELAALPDAEGQQIVARLNDRAGYHLASELAAMCPDEVARRELVDRLMARFCRDVLGSSNRPSDRYQLAVPIKGSAIGDLIETARMPGRQTPSVGRMQPAKRS